MSQDSPSLYRAEQRLVKIPVLRDDIQQRVAAALPLLDLVSHTNTTADQVGKLHGSIMMAPVAWPDYCVLCGTRKPDCKYKLSYTFVNETYTYEGIPICSRCQTARWFFLAGFYGPIVVGFLTAFAFAGLWYDVGFLAALLGLAVGAVVIVGWIGLNRLLLRRLYRGWAAPPSFFALLGPVERDMVNFTFYNGAYAEEFARGNGRESRVKQ